MEIATDNSQNKIERHIKKNFLNPDDLSSQDLNDIANVLKYQYILEKQKESELKEQRKESELKEQRNAALRDKEINLREGD